MADTGKGMIMGRPSCDWVHEWLPLLVDDSDGLACEDNDLNAEDRRLIERHLTECSALPAASSRPGERPFLF